MFHLLPLFGTGAAILPIAGLDVWLCGRRLAYEVGLLVALGRLASAILWSVMGLPRPKAPPSWR